MPLQQADVSEKERYLALHSTKIKATSGSNEQLRTAPLISLNVKATAKHVEFPQYGFLGCEIPLSGNGGNAHDGPDPILLNTNTPWSAFVCGSQGSGKSYTLSCMLENCLFSSPSIGKLPRPLAGVVFHNDTRSGGSVCEAAHLASLKGIKVNVLVSRSNYRTLAPMYQRAAGYGNNLTVHQLIFQSHHLNTERMHRLMAFSENDGSVPLYMEVIMRILREMAVNSDNFSYKDFQKRLNSEVFAPGQKAMMDMRFNLLESFLDMQAIQSGKKFRPYTRDIFAPEPGSLTIVDLSDPFLDASTVCVLFDICLSLFEERRPASGMVVALDEAHKFMTKTSSAADNFTEHLLTTIREQRHNATRVIIATQEPTISPKLLDLCSITLVHRFTSPDWLATLKNHLAAASPMTALDEGQGRLARLFEEIIDLNTGESLLFAPSAVVEVVGGKPRKLGARYLRFKTRRRLGADGGRSVLAIRNEETSCSSSEGEEDNEDDEDADVEHDSNDDDDDDESDDDDEDDDDNSDCSSASDSEVSTSVITGSSIAASSELSSWK